MILRPTYVHAPTCYILRSHTATCAAPLTPPVHSLSQDIKLLIMGEGNKLCQCDRHFSNGSSTINEIATSGSGHHDTDIQGLHPERDHLVDHTAAPKLGIVSSKGKMLKAVVYGAVNALAAIPCFFCYAAIISGANYAT